MNVSILDYGAVGDNKAMNTKAIQAAIDAVAAAGGGRVCVPAGTYLTGTLYLQDHIELHLEAGSTLKASTNFDDYNPLDAYPENSSSATEGWVGKHLIIGYKKTDVSITGTGTIDGSGDAFYGNPNPCKSFLYVWCFGGIAKAKNADTGRPGQMIAMIECTDLHFSDVKLINAPCWCLFLHGCELVTIRGLKIFNAANHANTDGIDIDTCRYVTVSDCIIDTGDDCITIRCNAKRLLSGKTTCEYVTVSNCVLACSACGIRLGVGVGFIKNIIFTGLNISRAGCAIEIMTAYKKRGNAKISSVKFENIIAENVSYPFRFTQWNDSYIKDVSICSYLAKSYAAGFFEAETAGMISDISIRDLNLQLVNPPFPLDDRAQTQRGMYAIENHGGRDISLENVRITLPEESELAWEGSFFTDEPDAVSLYRCNF